MELLQVPRCQTLTLLIVTYLETGGASLALNWRGTIRAASPKAPVRCPYPDSVMGFTSANMESHKGILIDFYNALSPLLEN